MKYDKFRRRVFPSEARALKAQENAVRYFGVWSGVIRNGLGWSLLHDPQAER